MDHIEPPDFTVVLRGYDREQVDEFIARATAQSLTAEQINGAAFTTAWRGYDREQVDHVLDRLAALANQKGIEASEGQGAAGSGFFSSLSVAPDFTVVLRGYDRDAVDAFNARIQARLNKRPEEAGLSPADIRAATFPVAWRGFDRAQVDHFLDAMADLVDSHDKEGL